MQLRAKSASSQPVAPSLSSAQSGHCVRTVARAVSRRSRHGCLHESAAGPGPPEPAAALAPPAGVAPEPGPAPLPEAEPVPEAAIEPEPAGAGALSDFPQPISARTRTKCFMCILIAEMRAQVFTLH